MKMNQLAIGLLLCAQVFAETQITLWAGPESQLGDAYIVSENSAELTKLAWKDIAKASFLVREKIQDPVNDNQFSYQIYQGVPAQLAPSLAKFDLPTGIKIEEVLQAKLYEEMDPKNENSDIKRVFSDGKSIYVEYASALFFKKGSKFQPLNKSISSNKLMPLASTTQNAVQQQMNSQAQADQAVADFGSRFGYGSEIKKYSAWTMIGVGAVLSGLSIYNHLQISKDKEKYDKNQSMSLVDEEPYKSEDIAARDAAWSSQKSHTSSRNWQGIAGLISLGGGVFLLNF